MSQAAKLLHALAGIDLGGKDIALSTDGDRKAPRCHHTS